MKTDTRSSALHRLRSLAHILDNAIPIPGTPYRIGIDPIVGLLPGGGDLVMAAFSVYIVWESARLGLPRSTVTRMVSNLVFDTVIGSVPVAGDLFDVTWKANSKNVRLLEAHLDSPQHQKKVSQGFVLLLLFGFLALVIGIAALSVFVIAFVWNAIVR
ncbi:MAG: DUF4112 domain-containing protein [Candidatus Parcubacteria bacterium]|uniref:DUF4112 domain-containing protein n=1 Tax=Phormidesmis priestleyi TaxID=268141 RepID=UPI00083A17A8|nr:DUF4112 domain-containing protein [Phormidesmis priestleyi]MBC7824505.1 DUF4112 domain-containing protein [Leptolyngbyaceae cyanobacterium LF-bin-113]